MLSAYSEMIRSQAYFWDMSLTSPNYKVSSWKNTGIHVNIGLVTNLILVPMVTPPCGEGRILL